ncbi:unnamed protein product [Triticum turgidum subsp. durum]|uniref:Uncharacterized protein n=1 Tax=Triticum turgidum subsp. durum TaxID=4567 RepID=A0A9R1RSB0_TRITD|nr:unnamed protein product [Triticum turgidum subsp. durum]
MAKCLAVALLVVVVLASCDGRELSQKDGALGATRGAGVAESKASSGSGLPDLPVVGTGTGTSTINGPLVVVPGVPVHP